MYVANHVFAHSSTVVVSPTTKPCLSWSRRASAAWFTSAMVRP
ncbi:hypothetical protein [Acutalibacter muris]|nr:hypothetical protein [Acutalibacter muris]